MPKSVLKLNDDKQFDFLLIGIVCQLKDYRICRELNLALEIHLSRQDDYEVFNNKRMEDQSFSFFQYVTPEEDEYCLVSNKCEKGLLIPEQNKLDYFLMIRAGASRLDEDFILARLKEIQMALGIYKMEAKKLKSRENLVF